MPAIRFILIPTSTTRKTIRHQTELFDLPREVLCQILEDVPVLDLFSNVALTCRGLYQVIQRMEKYKSFVQGSEHQLRQVVRARYERVERELSKPCLIYQLRVINNLISDSRRPVGDRCSGHWPWRRDPDNLSRKCERWFGLTETVTDRLAPFDALIFAYKSCVKLIGCYLGTYRIRCMEDQLFQQPSRIELETWTEQEYHAYLRDQISIKTLGMESLRKRRGPDNILILSQ